MSIKNQVLNIGDNYRAIVTPMTAVKFISIAFTAVIFAISQENWALVFDQFIPLSVSLLTGTAATIAFFAVQALEVLPTVATYGHDSPVELAARLNLAQRDPLTREFLKQDAVEEFRIEPTALICMTLIMAGAFALDLVINWYAWNAPVSGVAAMARARNIGLITVDWFGLAMVLLTKYGIPYIVRLALREAKRANYLVTLEDQKNAH